MKKIFLPILAFFLLVGSAQALKANKWTTLSDSNGQELTAYVTGSSTVVYTNAIDISGAATDKAALIITENVTGGSGDVDLSAQYSIDGVTFYDPYLTTSGTWYAEGVIAETITATTIYLEHDLHAAPFMRYKIDPDAASQITVKQILQYEK